MSQNSPEKPENTPGKNQKTNETIPESTENITSENTLNDSSSSASIQPEEEKTPEKENEPSQEEASPPAPDMAEEKTPAPILNAAAGAWATLFNGFAKGGPIILLIALFCMAWHDFVNPDKAIYCPAEFKAITAFLHCIAESSWLTPTGLNEGMWSLAQWPGFFWFTGLIALIPGIGVSDLLLPVVEYSAAALALIGIWWLAITARFGARPAFAAGLMAIACPLFAPLPHFMGPAALACAFFLYAILFFYRGWTAEHAFLSLPLAFIFTALAGLTGGFLLFVVPILASICFLVWAGRLKRAQKVDALFGFIIFLVIIGIWLGWIMLGNGQSNYLDLLFKDSLNFSWPLQHLWWAAIAAGFLGTMPWLLTIFGVSWVAVIKNAGKSLAASRHDNGSALIWISLVLTAGLSIWIPQFHPLAVCVASLFLILVAKAFLHMPPAGNRFFFFLASLITMCVGILLMAMHFEATQDWLLQITKAPIPQLARETLLTLNALPIIAGILIAGGICGFYFAKRNQHSGGLLYALLLAIILCQPGRLMLVPELGANPALPVKNYQFIQNEVEKALQTPAVTLPDHQPVPEQGSPAIDTPAVTPAQPEENTQNPQANSPAEQPAEEIIIIEPAKPAEPEAGQSPAISQDNNPAVAPNTTAPQNTPATGTAPEETVKPESSAQPAAPEVNQSKPPARQEEIIIEEIKPALPPAENAPGLVPALPESVPQKVPGADQSI